MIGVIFRFGTEIVEVRVKGTEVYFRNDPITAQWASIDGLKLNKSGVIKEFPDLKDNEDWQKIARDRFKDKVKELKSEEERKNYIIEDLSKFGYVPMYEQKQGFRPKKLS